MSPLGYARLSVAAVAAALALACGGTEPQVVAPVTREGPADQIFRIGRVWESQAEDSGFRTPPDPLASFETRIASRLTFSDDRRTARETLVVSSSFRLHDGRTFTCQSDAEITVRVRFADHAGEPAVEVTRARLDLARRCAPPGFPEASLEVPATVARFALRGDRLVAYQPPLERREYLPVQ